MLSGGASAFCGRGVEHPRASSDPRARLAALSGAGLLRLRLRLRLAASQRENNGFSRPRRPASRSWPASSNHGRPSWPPLHPPQCSWNFSSFSSFSTRFGAGACPLLQVCLQPARVVAGRGWSWPLSSSSRKIHPPTHPPPPYGPWPHGPMATGLAALGHRKVASNTKDQDPRPGPDPAYSVLTTAPPPPTTTNHQSVLDLEP
jgi:hypothetical protein